jgi:hypothetical protein
MESMPVTKIEFFGGPEDGRVLDAEALNELTETPLGEGSDSIPMILQDNAPRGPERGEFHLIGLYVAKEMVGTTLQYHWSGIPS